MTISKKTIARFKRAAEALAQVAQDVRQECPEATIYLASDTLCLLSGSSHDDAGGYGLAKARPERVVAQVFIPFSGGGDW